MLVRMLGLEEGGFCGGLTSIGERNECQRELWALKEGGLCYLTLVGNLSLANTF